MRRMGTPLTAFTICALVFLAHPAFAQDGKINVRVPPPPPIEEYPITRDIPVDLVPAMPPLPPVPESLNLQAGTRLAVVLDTPLSTRITKKGQRVVFKTSHWVTLTDLLELPPDTEISGTVVEARRPGSFGKPGTLQVKLENLELPAGTALPIAARLESPDANAQGKMSADSAGKANVADLAQWAIIGTLGGWQVAGGKGAGYGAATGAAIGLIILMARRGPDLYLEPGMPFTVVLDRDVALSGQAVAEAQRNYARLHGYSPNVAAASGSGPSMVTPDGQSRVSPTERPKLKRRPKEPQP